MGKAPLIALVMVFASACTQEGPAPLEGKPNAATSSSGKPVSQPAPPTPRELLPKLFAEPVRSAPAAPIGGGTLLVSEDGKTAVAADPDRDRVFLVDLATRAVRSVATTPGDELGRVVEGPSGTVFVAARRGGVILALDLATASVRARFPVCNAPRGLAYDGSANSLYVACRSGRFVTLDATSGAIRTSVDLDDDLRDVLLVNGKLFVTRFRSAELLELSAVGTVTSRATPPKLGNASAAVAFRALVLPNGMLALAHEADSDAELGTGPGAYYGAGCTGGGAVAQVLTQISTVGTQLAAPNRGTSSWSAKYSMRSIPLGNVVGPLDIAVARDGSRIGLIASGNSWQIASELPSLYVDELDLDPKTMAMPFSAANCVGTNYAHHLPGEPVAIAFDASNRYIVQSREPAMLEFEGDTFVSLSDESHYDTGFAMFHVNAGGGTSCASCHPEGGEDGHTWSFAQLGSRRSQALEANVGARAPFHWSGDLATFNALFDEVMLKRMALPVVPPAAAATALLTWLDTIPALPPVDDLEPTAVEHGRALFASDRLACASCHSGPAYSDGQTHDVGSGGSFVTPSLLGVGQRAPLMHDGCAKTLSTRFGACGGDNHGGAKELAAADIDALVAFMRSL